MHASTLVIVITGLSGSGKSTALRVFEDMGFFTVDGLPAALVPQFVTMFSQASLTDYKGVVIGMDLRQSTFAAEYEDAMETLRAAGFSPRLLFIEAKPAVLMQRYATTRRPHPLEKEGFGLEQALKVERSRLKKLRESADMVIDTSTHSVHDLRRALQSKWSIFSKSDRELRVHLITFGFKYGTPSEADMVFDLRFLPNPYFVEELQPLSGKDALVAAYVLHQDPGATFLHKLTDFLLYLLEENEKEGRYRLTIAIGCTGGRHRSVAVAEALNAAFLAHSFVTSLEHRHLELG